MIDHLINAGGFWYLASPYSHPDAYTVQRRAREVFQIMGWLLAHRVPVYSPIHHCHEASIVFHLPTDAAYWENLNQLFIRQSVGVIVYQLDGWRESRGVAGEVAYAREIKRPILRITPGTREIGPFYDIR